MAFGKDGVRLIDGAIAQFEGIVNTLDTGVALVNGKLVKNKEELKRLEAESDFLQEKSAKALIFRDNLKAMMSEKPQEK